MTVRVLQLVPDYVYMWVCVSVCMLALSTE